MTSPRSVPQETLERTFQVAQHAPGNYNTPNFEIFGAPHVEFLSLPEPFGLRGALDLGRFTQNLMLALGAHGSGSFPQTEWVCNQKLRTLLP